MIKNYFYFILLSLIIIPVYNCNSQSESSKKSGVIVDTSGVPISGISIQKYKSNSGTISDFDGVVKLSFEIGDTLVINSNGFNSIKLKVDENLFKNKSDDSQRFLIMVGDAGVVARYWCCTSHSETVHCNKNISDLKEYHNEDEVFEIKHQ